MCNILSVRIETLGCRLNQVESEALASGFLKQGFSIFERKKNNQNNNVVFCIVNTCTVTGKAEQKARRLIRLLLKEHTNALILVTGCYAELESDTIENIDNGGRIISFSGKKKDELDELPNYLISFFNKNRSFCIADLKKTVLEFRQKIYEKKTEYTDSKKMFKLSSPVFIFHSRASLKVQDGCNNSCAYCRIRLARGKSVSLPSKEVLRRISEIEKNGAAEVVLSGVNLSQYSCDIGGFADLLSLILTSTKKIRIRISSLYPDLINGKMPAILTDKRICPHFHLSIQSGSDKILKAMNRNYTLSDITKAVNDLRSVKDKPFIGCDIITGFPSETDEDFEQTFLMCKNLNFSGIHVFPFSARPGTSAFFMTCKVPERISGERAARLNTLSTNNYKEYLKSCNGKTFFAIAEKPIPGKPVEVLTENYLSLPLTGNKANYKGGEEVLIKVTDDKAQIVF